MKGNDQMQSKNTLRQEPKLYSFSTNESTVLSTYLW